MLFSKEASKKPSGKAKAIFHLFLLLVDFCYSQTVTTLAGGFTYPRGVAVDSSGNVYVGDYGGHRIRKITPTGSVSILAGSGSSGFNDAVGESAQFYNPCGVAIDSSGNIYVADQFNYRIRKITPAGSVSTLAGSSTAGFNDGQGTNAKFNSPLGIAIDSSGNLYVADSDNRRIRKITSSGAVTTLAGSTAGFNDGQGTNAQFFNPVGIAVDSSGNVYVGDTYNHKIRKITPAGSVSTLAGGNSYGTNDGQGTNAKFYYPEGVALDSSGNVYVGDASNNKVRKITPTGTVTTMDGGFNSPTGVAVDSNGNVYIADYNSNSVRKITAPNCPVGTFLSSGQCTSCSPGTFSNITNSPNCAACPVGTFTASSGRTNCTSCPQGSFCPSTGLVNSTLCPVNKYCPQSGLAQPVDCPLNSTNTRTGSISVDDCLCNAGLYKNGAICSGCPVGSYCPQNSSLPTTCPVGYYCPFSASFQPVICPQGSFCPSTGLASATMCPVNKYCPQSGLAQPIDCPLNSTNIKTGSISVDDCMCDAGFYKNGPICAGCPAGSYCPQNSSVPVTCPIGYYCPSTLLDSPTICPQGDYCPSVGMTFATQCGANSGTTGTGSTSSTNCVCNPGYSSVGGVCTLNQVTTTPIDISTADMSQPSSSLTNGGQNVFVSTPSSSTLSSSQTAGQSSDASSSKQSSGDGGDLAAALSNPAVIVIASGACLIVLAAIVNAVVAYRRISKAKLRRKVGITTNLTTGGVSTDGRSVAGVTTAEA